MLRRQALRSRARARARARIVLGEATVPWLKHAA